jgi:hypothetical protein
MLVVLPGLVDSSPGMNLISPFFNPHITGCPVLGIKSGLLNSDASTTGRVSIDFLMGDVQEGLGGQPGYLSRRV